MINVDGTGLERVTTAPAFDGFPMWSPDGKRLVWGSNRMSQETNETNIFITKDMDDLTRAGNLTNNGRRVCLLISADMLSRGTEGGFFTIPDHWIQMTGWGGLRGIGSGKKGAYATVWSWGYWYGLQTLPLKTIESRFFGYVAAVPPGR